MDSTVSSSKDPEQVLSLCQDNYTVNSLQCHQTHVGLWKEKKINIYAYSMKEMVKEWLIIHRNCNIKQLFVWKKKCGLIIFFLLKILAKQFILKNNETVENLHKMYIDSGLFFHWIHLPITTQHINHLCVSDAFFKGTFHKYKPTNKFFWTCIVKLTTIRHLTWQAHSVRIISIWTQYHGQLYWLFCTKKKPQRIKIWKHPNQFSNLAEYRKENLFFSV